MVAFLWIRARRAAFGNLQIVVADVSDPQLPGDVAADAALIANTLHELDAPRPVLDALHRSMRSGSRLVIVDRGASGNADRHSMTADRAIELVAPSGFRLVTRDDAFIRADPDGEPWWLLVFVRD